MRVYYFIIKNRRGQVATDNRIKADKAPIGWDKPFRFETRQKADNFANKLNAYFGCFMYLKKDEFFAVRQSEVIADPKPVEPKPVKTEGYLLDTYKKTGAMWEMGAQLPSIVRDLAEVYGDRIIDVLVPIGSCFAGEEDSYDFHCFGSARDIAYEIPRLMPSHKERYGVEGLLPENAKTCYYGDDNNIGSGTFLPFLADDSVYHIESINKTAEKVVIKLIRGLSRWAYL